MRLPRPALLLVTDRTQARGALADVVERALSAGCRWVSLREKDLPPADQMMLAAALKPIAARYRARLTVHGDPAVARAAGLDGVHLPGGGSAGAARAMLGDAALIGISVHLPAEAQALDPRVLDYAVAGPAFATASKPGYGPLLGASGLAAIVRAAAVPIVAIGGVAASNAAAVLATGAAGIAVMGGVMRAEHPADEVRGLLAALDDGAQPRPR